MPIKTSFKFVFLTANTSEERVKAITEKIQLGLGRTWEVEIYLNSVE